MSDAEVVAYLMGKVVEHRDAAIASVGGPFGFGIS